jgi:GT2 family glycosyltransferase/serine acetyltransferase
MRLAGVLVNYRTAEMTARAADALLSELAGLGSYAVYVVDNDSGDGSLDTLRQQAEARGWGERVTIVAAPRNGGYGYGINVAVQQALGSADPPEYVYVINSDAFPDRGSIGRLVAFMDAHPEAGIAGSHVHGPDGTSQGAAFRFPSVWSELETTAGIGLLSRVLARHIVSVPAPSAHREIDWIPGTSMLIRRTAIERAGLFDEAFFLYFEEVDFCRRLAYAGFKCFYVADAPITHIGCVSTGMLDTERRMPRYWFESRHLYFLKHHGRAYAAAADLAWLTGYAAWKAKNRLLKRSTPDRPRMFRDFLAASLRNLPTLRRPSPDEARVEAKGDDAATESSGQLDARRADELGLLELLAEDFATHNRDLTQPGLWALVAHRLGRRADAIESSLARRATSAVYELMFTGVDCVWGIHLPRSVEVGRRVRLWHNGCMLLTARSIGNDVHIRHDTTFGPVRGRDAQSLPVIEDRADLGSGVCVLGDVTVGHDAMVGANSVVMKSIPPRTMALGVPARVVPA